MSIIIITHTSKEHQGLGCITTRSHQQRGPSFGLCYNTMTPAKNTKVWAVSQHTDTSKEHQTLIKSFYKTRACLVCCSTFSTYTVYLYRLVTWQSPRLVNLLTSACQWTLTKLIILTHIGHVSQASSMRCRVRVMLTECWIDRQTVNRLPPVEVLR